MTFLCRVHNDSATRHAHVAATHGTNMQCLSYLGGSAQLVKNWENDNAVFPGSWITGTGLGGVVKHHAPYTEFPFYGCIK